MEERRSSYNPFLLFTAHHLIHQPHYNRWRRRVGGGRLGAINQVAFYENDPRGQRSSEVRWHVTRSELRSEICPGITVYPGSILVECSILLVECYCSILLYPGSIQQCFIFIGWWFHQKENFRTSFAGVSPFQISRTHASLLFTKD